ELHLEVVETAGKFKGASIQDRLKKYEAAKKKDDPLAAWQESMAGGDAENGRRLFYTKAELSCMRCHKIHGEGGEVGPELAGIGARQKRDYLLESIVAPSKQIAKGYETAVILLNNGKTVSGIVKAEDDKEVKLMTPEGQLIVVGKKDIDERQQGKSAMPDDLIKYLNKSELRDLVEFLASLREEPK